MYFAERKYLEEATRIGPSPDETIPPVILAYDPPSPARTAPEQQALLQDQPEPWTKQG